MDTSKSKRRIAHIVAAYLLIFSLGLIISSTTVGASIAEPQARLGAASVSTSHSATHRRAAQPNSVALPLTDTQYFQDISSGSFFYTATAELYLSGLVSGYTCGQPPAGACVPPANLPYYLPSNNVSRGQMSFYIQNARTKPGISIATNSDQLPVEVNDGAAGAASFYGTVSNVGIARDPYDLSAGFAAFASAEDPISNTANAVGMVAESLHDNGAWFASYDNGPYHYASIYVINNGNGVVIGDNNSISNTLTVHGPLVVDGPKTGYVVDIMQNMGTSDLHPGDVVVAADAPAGAAVVGEIPVPAAQAASLAYDTGALGVVDMHWVVGNPQAPIGSQARGGYYDQTQVIHPGEYMGVVTLGAYKAIRVDASLAPIHVGDLLTTGGTAGAAMRADDSKVKIGSIVGKALGNLKQGTGTIPVMVMLR